MWAEGSRTEFWRLSKLVQFLINSLYTLCIFWLPRLPDHFGPPGWPGWLAGWPGWLAGWAGWLGWLAWLAGWAGWTPAKHARKIGTATVRTGGFKATIQQGTHETRTKHQRELETTTAKHSPPPNEHESSVKGLTARIFVQHGRPGDGRGTTDDPQIRAPSPSHWRIVSRSQLRSLARTHATQTQAQSKSISRFGGRTKPAPHPQPPILFFFDILYIRY